MKTTLEEGESSVATVEQPNICEVCARFVEGELHSIDALHESLHPIVRSNAATPDASQLCRRCVEIFSRAQRQIESHSTIFEQNDFVLPTPLRMGADERFTGRGVTIAFLDSGFYAHPDLTKPTDRIVAYKSIFSDDGDRTSLETSDVMSWHGMMTSVVAAGNGGLTAGSIGDCLRCEFGLVKIGLHGSNQRSANSRGLEWVLEHALELQIRVVNISAGGDFEESYLTNSLAQTVERCTRAGLTVVCAVGNAGHVPGHPGFAAGERAFMYRRWRSRRSELARSRAPGNVSLVVWANYRWPAKTGSHRAGHLGRRAYSAKDTDCRRGRIIFSIAFVAGRRVARP